jgi:alkylation response protein AidB-like acyl-CoA dehydrogenase
MSDPGITVRPIGAMLGPHHLNEVFFDDLRVTEADVLGTVDDGWSIVADVLSFERLGIARYARCERLLQLAPRMLGTLWDALPSELRGRWARMLTHCRRARLLAYRLVSLQSEGKVAPTDVAAYRIAVTKLDQDSAEVLMELVAELDETGPEAAHFRREVEDHWRYSQAATVSSGSIEMQRILLSRSMLAVTR